MEAGVNAVPDPFPLVLRRLAQLDIESAAAWYEDRVNGLGVRFVEEVDFCLDSITANPEACPIVHRVHADAVDEALDVTGACCCASAPRN